MAIHHKLCHVLGGAFDFRMPRATLSSCHTRSPTTPPAAPEAMARITHALGARSPDGPLRLRRGSARRPPPDRHAGSGLDRATDIAVANPYWESAAVRPGGDRCAARRCLARQAAGHMNGALTTPWPACGTGLPRHATRGAGTTASHTLPSLRSPPRLLQRAGTSRPSIAWYERVLGFTVEVRHHIDAVSRRHGDARSGDRCGSSCPMSPTPSRFPTSGGSPNTDHYTHGTKHVGFAVAHIRCAGRGRDGTRRRATTPFSARRRSRSSPSSATIPAISSRFVEQPDLWSADAAGEKTSERP